MKTEEVYSMTLSEKGPTTNDDWRGKLVFFWSYIHEALGNVCRHSGDSEPRANTSAKR